MKKILFIILIFTFMAFAFGQYSKVVAVGDSLMAGYSSGGLVQTYQQYSMPALVAAQCGISDFEQPLVSEPGIPALLKLIDLTPTIAPITTDPSQFGHPLNLNLQRPYDNLAVPGSTLYDALNTVTDNGGMHDLILRGLGTQVQQAISLHPDLLLVWTGNNDVLGAAVSGTPIPGVTLTPKDVFQAEYDQLISTLSSNTSADILVATIPSVVSIPFVTTIPPFIINPATGQPVTDNSGNPVTYLGQSDNGSPFIAPNSYVLLTAAPYLAQGYGIPTTLGGNGQPLPDSVVLTPNEIATIEDYVNTFNSDIKATAQKYGCAVFDINSIFSDIVQNGVEIGGITLTSKFLVGGIFGLDGVHPTPIGYAITAEYMIQTINQAFGKNIPDLDLYPFIFDSPVCCMTMGNASKINLRKLKMTGFEGLYNTFCKKLEKFQNKVNLINHLGEINPLNPVYPIDIMMDITGIRRVAKIGVRDLNNLK